MTEEEAKVKWCPFARVVRASETGIVASDQAAMNRFDVPDRTKSPQTPLASHCIASACMAWRWEPISPADEQEPRTGFCGLAGAPQ